MQFEEPLPISSLSPHPPASPLIEALIKENQQRNQAYDSLHEEPESRNIQFKLAYWLQKRAFSDSPDWGTKSSPENENPQHFESIFQRPSLSQQLINRNFMQPEPSSDRDYQRAIVPFSLKLPSNNSISEFALASDFSAALALSTTGQLWFWKGKGEIEAQEELDTYKYLEYLQETPTRLECPERVSRICCTSQALLFLSQNGVLWHKSANSLHFKKLKIPSRVSHFASCSLYSIALTNQNDLYAWGQVPSFGNLQTPQLLMRSIEGQPCVSSQFFAFIKSGEIYFSGHFSQEYSTREQEISRLPRLSETVQKADQILVCEQLIVCRGKSSSGKEKISVLTSSGQLYKIPSSHSIQNLSLLSCGVLTGFVYTEQNCFFYSWSFGLQKCTAHIYQVEKSFLAAEAPQFASSYPAPMNLIIFAQERNNVALCNQDSLELSAQETKLKTPDGRSGLSGTFANIGEILKFRESIASSSSPNFAALALLRKERQTPQRQQQNSSQHPILVDRSSTTNSSKSSMDLQTFLSQQLTTSPKRHVRIDTPKWGEKEGYNPAELNPLSERKEEEQEASLCRQLLRSSEFDHKKEEALQLRSISGSNELLGTAAFKSPQMNMLITSTGLQFFATYFDVLYARPEVLKEAATKQEFMESTRNLQDSLHSSRLNTRYRVNGVAKSSDMTIEDLASSPNGENTSSSLIQKEVSMVINDCSSIEPSGQKHSDFSQKSPLSSEQSQPFASLLFEENGHVRKISDLNYEFEKDQHSPFLLRKVTKLKESEALQQTPTPLSLPPLTPRSQPPKKNVTPVHHVRNLSEVSKVSTTSLVNYTCAESPNISVLPKSPSALSFLNFTKSPAGVKEKFKEFSKLLLQPKSPMVGESADSNVHERVKKNLANRFLTKGERAAEIVFSVLQIHKPFLKSGFQALKRLLLQHMYERVIKRGLRKLRPILDLRFKRKAFWRWREIGTLQLIKLSGEKLVATRMIYSILAHLLRAGRDAVLRSTIRRLHSLRHVHKKCIKLLRVWRGQTCKRRLIQWKRFIHQARSSAKTANLAKKIALQRYLKIYLRRRYIMAFSLWKLLLRFHLLAPKIDYFLRVRQQARAWVKWRWLKRAYSLRKALRLCKSSLNKQKVRHYFQQQKREFVGFRNEIIKIILKEREIQREKRIVSLRKFTKLCSIKEIQFTFQSLRNLHTIHSKNPSLFMNKQEHILSAYLFSRCPFFMRDAFLKLKHFQGGRHAATVQQLVATLKLALHRRKAKGLQRIIIAAITCRVIEQDSSEARLRFPYLKHHPLRGSLDMLKSSATLLTKLKMKRLAIKTLMRLLKSKLRNPLQTAFTEMMKLPLSGFHPSIRHLSPIGPRDSFGDNVRIGDASLLIPDPKELALNQESDFIVFMGRARTKLSQEILESATFKSAEPLYSHLPRESQTRFQDMYERQSQRILNNPIFSKQYSELDVLDNQVLAPDPPYLQKKMSDFNRAQQTIYQSGELTFKPQNLLQDHRRDAAALKLKTPKNLGYSSSKSTRYTKSPNNTLRGFTINTNKVDLNQRGSTLGGGSSIDASHVEVNCALHSREMSRGFGGTRDSGSRTKKKNFLQDNINQIKIIERQASKRGLSRQHSRCVACRKPGKENIRPNHTIVGLVAESLQKQMTHKLSPHIPRLNLQALRQPHPRTSVETASSVNKTMTSFISPAEHPLIFSGASNNTTLILPQETLDAIRQSGLRANSSCRRKKASSRASRPQSRGSIIMRQRMSINQATRGSTGGLCLLGRPRVGEAKRLIKLLLIQFQKVQTRGLKKVREFAREHKMREINQEALRRLGPFASQLNRRSSELWIYNKERKRSQAMKFEAVEAVAKVKILGARLLVTALCKRIRSRFGEFRRSSRKCKNRSEIERLWRKY